ncbi:type IV pilus biogenesis/stability protein PilW [Vibrio cincinnatiensis]|jgi:type IV pilus assembly protein PilF|uniref:Type IV pilus assembly protein PilF n=1 Tax=Vibrio cincinnatiensis DSM 19608 TaxID=1123491 RepID=A0A1T4KVK3_VIBCI|nr:type IV pilus biogenesis/stability protein PilW [Vibrio cincinnatiensis]MCG3723852.1 type IV pilus biogenesis/stability protein PilW [Vibrio cincinnatiensis]MCG3727290.1 type IV pilus biogenesis/stability protein PilW [Vibrio cincinnatiensis]MCG3733485.1 type IV pilus biogenesis/stability protein PilW [Vibrio cincinnatiensis]MCG3737653.1 type IV pilus biogenesis/stability protein PilW [Vibrio cincinnatiensis]MCG3740815.1 type IV pilus biogenesis/stability protein PilW [Vibrio cincinnatiensi
MKYVLALGLSLGLTGCITITENEQAESISNPIEIAESRIELGLGYLENGNRVKARQNLQIAIQHAPRYYRAQLSMAHYLETVGEHKAANEFYQNALRDNPRNGNVLNNYGTFLCKQGEYAKADQFFMRAVKQPYYYLIPASYENAAFCALKANDHTKAKDYFKRVLDHDPTRVNSLLQLAKLQMDDNELTQARIHLMKLHQQYGYQRASLQLLMELEQRAGNRALEKKYQSLLDNFS